MDRFTSVLLFAGLGCFLLAFALSGLYPWMITDGREPEASIAEVASKITPEFRQLKEQYPVSFAEFPASDRALTSRDLIGVDKDDPRRAASEEAWQEAHAHALRRGRDVYISEACWHCHSQFVRQVANEEQRFGRVRTARDDANALQRPVLWGTRRVGPDLTNEGGRRSNDWHVAHLYDPESTSPDSVMPPYTWYFRDGYRVARTIDPDVAERTGIDSARSYPLAGVYATRADAEAALAVAREATPENLRPEVERLHIEEATGPDADAIALIAYLQWLGTWTEEDTRKARE